MKTILNLIFISLVCGCNNNSIKEPNTQENNAQSISSPLKNIPDSVIISPIYPDSVFFVVNAELSDVTEVKGKIDSFHNRIKNTHELYFQRFVEKQKQFRVIHAVGTGIETIKEFGKEENKANSFNDTIKFDELGIFAGEPGDPIDLIPLYPGHHLKKGEYWTPDAKVKIAMGAGIAKYKFVIDSLYVDNTGSTLARITVVVNAELEPSKELTGGKVTVSGGGWLIWDCTINQRRETHLKGIYLGIKGQNEVKQIIKVDDKLDVYSGKRYF